MADTTVYTVSAGYLPFLATQHGDFDVKRWTQGQRRVMADGGVKWDGVELKGPEALMPDGSLRKARIRGSVGWFEYSTKVKGLVDTVSTDKTLKTRLDDMAQQFYNRDLKGLSEELLNSFINSGFLGDISPTGEEITTGERGTPEERFNPQDSAGFTVTNPSKGDVNLVGRANTIDMYVEQGGNIYRMDVTAMTFDSQKAHHGLSDYEDRVASGVTGKQLMKDIKEGGHAQGSTAQKKLHKYFQRMNSGWNEKIQSLKTHAYNHGDAALRRQMDALHRGSTTLKKLGTDFAQSLETIRGGAKGEAAAKIDPRVAQTRQKYRTKQSDYKNWDKRFKKYKRSTRHVINTSFANSTISASTFSASVEFVLHALGNMLEIASQGAGQFGGKEYGYSTGYGMGEGLAGNFVVEVMHRINTKGQNVLLFKNIRSQDVIIHNEAQLTHVYRNKLLSLEREVSQAVHEQEAIRQNSSFSANLVNDGHTSIEVGGITTAAMTQVAGEPKLGYAAVIAPTRVNDDINAFINTLHGNPKKIRNLLGTKGKTINLTSRFKAYQKLLADPNESLSGDSAEGSMGLFMAQRLGGGQKSISRYFGNEKVAGRSGVQQGISMMTEKFERERMREMSGFATGAFKGSGVEAWEGAGGMASSMLNPALKQLSRGPGELGIIDAYRTYWGLNPFMSSLMKQNFDETTVPDFWAAPYLTLLYPSQQVTVRGQDYER
nr:hypothetical protein [uncultured Mediterranean phage uvMED]